MAQALFDEHPLEIYLRSAGEEPQFIPGSSPELELELDPTRFTLDDGEDEELEWRPLFLIKICEALLAIISALDLSSHPNLFVERFKYDVISSSLLAVSLPSTLGRSPRPSLPGQLSHSRASSVEAQLNTPTSLTPTTSDSSYLIPSLAFGFSVVFFNAGYTTLAIASLGATVHILKTMHDTSKHDMSPSLESLNDLIASSNEWESVVQAAISTLETDERNLTTYSTTTPATPSSSIRIALQSSLLTTQTQCDNVRHLFSALTSPSELSQLSEMYAPPSPMNPNFFPFDASQRPLSLPARRRRSSLPSEIPFPSENKRSTWNGSYTQLAQVGRSPNPVFRRREKRRSDLSSLLQASDSRGLLSPKALSAPVTPIPINTGPSLPGVTEEADSEHEESSGTQSAGTLHTFGSAALDLHRSRKSGGMEAFRIPPPSYFSMVASPTPQTPRTPASSTLSSGSRLTPIQTTRHPLSISALHHALQGALASKRYACSHLLALRFSDEEDEGYWEDVRSVMGLLTTTLADAASRLNVAMEAVEHQKLRDQNPTPCLQSDFPVSEYSENEDQDATFVDAEEGNELDQKPIRKQLEEVSFAPMPSHVTRFATHVEAITAALDDARNNLADCVAALREERVLAVSPKRRSRSRRSMQVPDDSVPESRALEAYERLRRELGLALRECERGRERLLDIVFPPNLREDSDSDEDLPGLGHDASDDSDKVDSAFPFDDDIEPEGVGGYTMVAVDSAEAALDDVTSHLLLTASTQHLPPPGIEQVYEADSGNVGMFTRERSKLTREERIRLVKARRESGGSVLGLGEDISSTLPLEKEKHSGVEMWGPGGDVVQELKDVIWKVGERRRKMLEGPLDSVVPTEARSDLVLS
ncbi:hypothetical protein BDZ94DRAFT_1188976 [Collybia nuda]|uniref:Myosin-binding domain-containing protein n=1 Tax=Collybia nuda TaxID=64659 RepID=A0A9P6CKN8_9AGAR|nr:hypothetical protein BDZ94DRAFT_1188976 [Collybia nuda]